jgi:Predicted endonuclease containing a URI domain
MSAMGGKRVNSSSSFPRKHLLARIAQHRQGLVQGFARDYGVKILVWFEQHATIRSAITREKRIKKWNRAWKLSLIEAGNRQWRDLAEDFGLAALDS